MSALLVVALVIVSGWLFSQLRHARKQLAQMERDLAAYTRAYRRLTGKTNLPADGADR